VKWCCTAFKAAVESGTDSEGFGSLFWWNAKWVVGSGMPQPRYCPWCGQPIVSLANCDHVRRTRGTMGEFCVLCHEQTAK
jgi:hypothetical protein